MGRAHASLCVTKGLLFGHAIEGRFW